MKLVQLISPLLLLTTSYCAYSARLTAIDEVIQQQDIGCSTELRQLALTTLKDNPYRILAYDENATDIHLFNALAVSSFRDRDSHVSFHAVKNNDGSCDTSVTQTYILQTTCNDARNEAFSKWQQLGKLNERTTVLASKRIKGKQAFLTSQFSTLCLVTTRQVINNSAVTHNDH